jgi:hypothetical protein
MLVLQDSVIRDLVTWQQFLFNHFKHEIHLNNKYLKKTSSCLTEHTLHLHYKDQRVNAVRLIMLFITRIIRYIKYSVVRIDVEC